MTLIGEVLTRTAYTRMLNEECLYQNVKQGLPAPEF
jgi:hypothetical protein